MKKYFFAACPTGSVRGVESLNFVIKNNSFSSKRRVSVFCTSAGALFILYRLSREERARAILSRGRTTSVAALAGHYAVRNDI